MPRMKSLYVVNVLPLAHRDLRLVTVLHSEVNTVGSVSIKPRPKYRWCFEKELDIAAFAGFEYEGKHVGADIQVLFLRHYCSFPQPFQVGISGGRDEAREFRV